MVVEKLAQSVQADVFHLYSLKDQTAYASVVLNYFVTGAPVLEWKIQMPATAGNISVEGEDVRTWRPDEDVLVVTLHQPVIGAFTLLVTYEEEVGATGGVIHPGQVVPLDVRGERGFIQVVSPVQVNTSKPETSEGLLRLDPLVAAESFHALDGQLERLIAELIEENPQAEAARGVWRSRVERIEARFRLDELDLERLLTLGSRGGELVGGASCLAALIPVSGSERGESHEAEESGGP